MEGDEQRIHDLYRQALTFHQRGELAQANSIYREILNLHPRHAEALNGLGVLSYQFGHKESALDLFQRTLVEKPDYSEAHANLGSLLRTLGRSEQAIASFQTALSHQPHFPNAYYNLGNVYKDVGRLGDAEASYREAIHQHRNHPDAQIQLGLLLHQLGRDEEALVYLFEAAREHPQLAKAHDSLGKALCRMGRYDEGIVSFREAVRLQPNSSEIHHNLGTALKLAGELDASIASFESAIRIQPQLALAQVNRATTLLMKGDFEQGWPAYEWRWHVPNLSPRRFPKPIWDGQPLPHGTILLHTEQGLGDTFQFIRYAPLVKAIAGRTILCAPSSLLKILAPCAGIDILTDDVSAVNYDVHAPLLSLPHLLNSIPTELPYLHVDPELVTKWRARLEALPGYRVGVCWQGNRAHPEDRQRSFPLAHFAPLAQIPGVRLISLQQGPGSEQLSEVSFPIDTPGEVDLESDRFMDTAAILKNLDLVVTADTSIAHLAGGLGVPVWLALPSVPDWRWQLNRTDSLWYSNIRLFRQPSFGDWEHVFASIAEALAERVSSRVTA